METRPRKNYPLIMLRVQPLTQKGRRAYHKGIKNPLNPGAALIVKSCGTNISSNVRDGAL